MPTNTTEPEIFTQGTTQDWTISSSDYSAADSWVLSYEFSGPSTLTALTGTPNGDDWDLTFNAAATATAAIGVYYFQAFVSLAGAVHQIRAGQFTLNQSLATINDYDGRSTAKKILDAIDAQLSDTASADQKKYKIADVEIEKFTPAELLDQRNYWARIVVQEVRKDRIRQGKTTSRTIKTRFPVR